MTGLRAFAAYAIVLKHCSLTTLVFADQEQIKLIFNQFAFFGMSLFFVLSGFVIHYNYGHQLASWDGHNLRSFVAARIARLYPLFLLLLALDFACSDFLANATPEQPTAYFGFLPFFLTKTQSWVLFQEQGLFVGHPYQLTDVAWSISTEWGTLPALPGDSRLADTHDAYGTACSTGTS